MIKINTLSILYVGIDVSSKSNVVYAMDFEQNKLLSDSFLIISLALKNWRMLSVNVCFLIEI